MIEVHFVYPWHILGYPLTQFPLPLSLRHFKKTTQTFFKKAVLRERGGRRMPALKWKEVYWGGSGFEIFGELWAKRQKNTQCITTHGWEVSIPRVYRKVLMVISEKLGISELFRKGWKKVEISGGPRYMRYIWWDNIGITCTHTLAPKGPTFSCGFHGGKSKFWPRCLTEKMDFGEWNSDRQRTVVKYPKNRGRQNLTAKFSEM